ncbi:glypican-6 [Bacillus rossius redtenbacheri]|uniref:glypican-6 n=1 Tax=Bacillus rossius redtenbacheri TaxID=93214 RepID=UPI002FDEBFB0
MSRDGGGRACGLRRSERWRRRHAARGADPTLSPWSDHTCDPHNVRPANGRARKEFPSDSHGRGGVPSVVASEESSGPSAKGKCVGGGGVWRRSPAAETHEECCGESCARGAQLRVCPQEQTCCTPEMEQQLSAQSRREFDKAVRDSLNKLGGLLRTRARRFDGFFKDLLATSKKDFHEMFKRTYGILYEQNSYVFTDLFGQLERYFSTGHVDLSEALENFFNTLYQKMFTVLNAQYHFDDKYLVCVGEHMKDLNPFGDVPHKLSIQLKRSFVATRTFSQALNVANDVISNMIKIPPSPECVRALTKMSGCSACQGLPDLKACSNYCINVMKGCLSYYTELDTEWNHYVDAIEKVTERLLGPFNIEMVVEPINIKISEAIMNFQENGPEVTQRVFSGCGKPVLGRRRRDTTELNFEPLEFGKLDSGPGDNVNSDSSLDKLVKDIRQKVKDLKQFWVHLPYHICNNDNVAAGPGKDDSCWNGEMKAKYDTLVAGDGLVNQRGNPEVAVDVNRPSSVLNEQVFTLRAITSKLQSAYNGHDVEWIDYEETSYGSGSGSGDGTDDTEDGDAFEGSGAHYVPPPDAGPKPHKPVPGITDPEAPRDTYNTTAGSGRPSLHPRVSVGRAVATYLLPIVVMWFGGMFSDWL